jgi:hypothetical protein
MALDESALSELLAALRAGGGLDVVREGLALVHDYEAPHTLAGVRIRLVGFVTPQQPGRDGYLLTRFALNCCAAAATAIKVAVRGDPVPRAPDTWLEVEGRWQQRTSDDPTPAILSAAAAAGRVHPGDPATVPALRERRAVLNTGSVPAGSMAAARRLLIQRSRLVRLDWSRIGWTNAPARLSRRDLRGCHRRGLGRERQTPIGLGGDKGHSVPPWMRWFAATE